jgi:hypothetical protein
MSQTNNNGKIIKEYLGRQFTFDTRRLLAHRAEGAYL